MLLLAVLLLFPTLSRSLRPLLTSNIRAALWFPPFWFLGVYERLLKGPSTLPVFSQLARNACSGLFLMLAAAVLTYPLAYRRRVRQLIEGARTASRPASVMARLHRLLDAAILRFCAQRAVFRFVSQTVLRAQRQRVMLALYGGLALALALSNMVVLRISSGHLRAALLPYGIRTAIPILGFWTVMGLRAIVSTPIDRRGSWLFRVLIGRPGPGHIAGVRTWITMWALLVTVATALILRVFSPESMRTPLVTTGQLLVTAGISLLFTDVCLFPVRTIPFTYLRTSSITDFPLMIVRYFVFFPFFVVIIVHWESWIEASAAHLSMTLLLVAIAHLLLLKVHDYTLRQSTLETPLEEGDEFPQRLGLRDH
jgi:hypothetical protein